VPVLSASTAVPYLLVNVVHFFLLNISEREEYTCIHIAEALKQGDDQEAGSSHPVLLLPPPPMSVTTLNLLNAPRHIVHALERTALEKNDLLYTGPKFKNPSEWPSSLKVRA
jgi:hypothetical protein